MEANAHEIIPRLWIGNLHASQSTEFIRSNNINTVFNCTKTLPYHPDIPNKYRVPVDDNLQEAEIRNMELWSSEIALKLIREYQNNSTILVHCHAGMQRSCASVAFFLIAYKKMKAEEAIQFIKSKRPIAFHGGANFGRAIKFFSNKFHNEIRPVVDGFIPSTSTTSHSIGEKYHVVDSVILSTNRKAKLD
jgi:atypical dual specificity phosphatase